MPKTTTTIVVFQTSIRTKTKYKLMHDNPNLRKSTLVIQWRTNSSKKGLSEFHETPTQNNQKFKYKILRLWRIWVVIKKTPLSRRNV